MRNDDTGVPSDGGWIERHSGVLMAAVVLIAFALRLYRLGGEDLWLDEGFSLRDAGNPDLLGGTRPLYFIVLALWMKIVPHTELWLRLPSALFGGAAVWLLYVVGRRLLGSGPAVIASLLMAISVLQVNHSREIRMYSMMAFLILLATYVLILAIERRQARYIAAYLALAVAALMTQPLTILILAAHGLFMTLYARAYRPVSYGVIGGLVAVVVGYAPWIMNNARVASDYAQGITSMLEKPTPLGAVNLLGKFLLWKWQSPSHSMLMVAMAFSLLVTIGAIFSLKGLTRSDSRRVFVWLWLAVPLAGMAVMSYAIGNVWMPHYLIAAAPAFYLLVAQGIRMVNRRSVTALAVGGIVLATSGRLWLYMSKPAHPEWERAVAYVQTHEKPGDVIGLYYGGNKWVFRYYYHGAAQWSPLDTDSITAQHWTGWDEPRVLKLLSGLPPSGKRIWMVLSNHDMAGGPVITEVLSKRYKLLAHEYYSQIEVMLVDPGKVVHGDSSRIDRRAGATASRSSAL